MGEQDRSPHVDLDWATAGQLADAVRRRQVSSRELVAHALDRIDRLNPALNAVVTVDREGAEAAAAAADEVTAAGAPTGPLHGVPMTIKDIWLTAGMRSTAGSPALADHVADVDAVAVARLRAAGAVIVGKTNVPLHAGDHQTYNDVFGTTNNPWDLTRTVGGSSGGAAAALAAGLVPLELGSDIGGSIRSPSHYCGTYGLKPSWGLVPDPGYLGGPPGSLVEVDVNSGGPMARSVADLALGLDVLAGPLPADAVAWRLELPASGPVASVRGLRLALAPPEADFPVAAEVRTAIRRYADRLADAGAVVEEVTLPVALDELFDSWLALVTPIIGAEMPLDGYAAMLPLEGIESDDRTLRAGQALVGRYRARWEADERRQRHRLACAQFAGAYDAVLAPVMPTAAYPHDVARTMPERVLDVDGTSVSHLEVIAWCAGIGTLLVPVVALPIGPTSGGLPVGVQVVGRYLEDRRLLAVAAALDEAAGGFVLLVGRTTTPAGASTRPPAPSVSMVS